MENSPCVILAWQIAASEAHAATAAQIEPAHLMIGLCKLCDLGFGEIRAAQPDLDKDVLERIDDDVEQVQAAFGRAGLDPTRFRRRLRAMVAKRGARLDADRTMHRSEATRSVFRRAEEIQAAALNVMREKGWPVRINERLGEELKPVYLLRALFEVRDAPWEGLLAEMGVHDPLEKMFGWERDENASPAGKGENGAPEKDGPRRAPSTPFLTQFGRDLTTLAEESKLDPVIGRRQEMRNLARVLTQKRKSNAILVGEAGVGKTCIVEGLAQQLASPNAPPALKEARLVEISIAQLVAGTKYRGEFEERMQSLIKEAASNPQIILFIDEIHTIIGAGGAEGSMDAANILKPALARGDIRCIGATTIAEYRKHFEKDPALERRFQMVWVDEPTRDEAVDVLKGLRPRFEQHHGLEIGDEAIQAAVDLSLRYLPDFRLPDKAIDLIDQACAGRRIQSLSVNADQQAETRIGRADVATVVAQRCHLPLEKLTVDESERLLRMEETLRRRVIGQDEAVRLVSDAVRTARVGLKDPRRPVGVFLFAGSTGTGKTELAKALAEFLFDDERRLIRVDMSEYMEKHSISRLIGAPPGYIGHDEEGQLSGPVRTNPFSVVLFDEIEKAHPDILDVLLQILDEGRLTDARGRRVSFAETVIILTSNLGTKAVAAPQHLGLQLGPTRPKGEEGGGDKYRQQVMAGIRGALRPELVNRIQSVVLFYPLGEDAVRRIIDKVLGSLRLRLHERKMRLNLTEAAYSLLMAQGYSPEYGAREMERIVERLIVQPLGRAILEGRFSEEADIQADGIDGQLVLRDLGRTRRAGVDD